MIGTQQHKHERKTNMGDTMKKIIADAHSLAKSEVADDLVRAGVETIARRLERLAEGGLYITPKAAIDAVLANPPTGEADGRTLNQILAEGLGGGHECDERDIMSRADAVRVLMQLQRREARAGHVAECDALEQAVANIVRRHRQTCRNKAKRNAA